ncbi:hypothetical protein V6U77_16950 [Micromonospora sp. CPCC 205546]|uniref:hypothetical protein n=1 Tax=Micromonospora sp. CPCC 205546 TaxID=3122397 RepID=UPI002FF09722
MVTKRTINDWYANAEGRGSSDFRHDWENDDLPDRTPDVWLDRLQSKGRAATTSPARQRAPRPAAAGASPNRQSSLRQQNLADAARALKARMRGVKDTTIARHLAQNGWPAVSAAQIREALRAYPAQTRKQLTPKGQSAPRGIEPAKKKQQSYGTITIISPPTATRKPTGNDGAVPVPQALVKAAHAAHAWHPQLGIKQLTREVRKLGWHGVTQEQVQAALLKRPLPPQSGPSLRSVPVPVPVPRPVERAPHPDACFACGVVPSLLGMCRCS